MAFGDDVIASRLGSSNPENWATEPNLQLKEWTEAAAADKVAKNLVRLEWPLFNKQDQPNLSLSFLRYTTYFKC